MAKPTAPNLAARILGDMLFFVLLGVYLSVNAALGAVLSLAGVSYT